MLIGARHNDSTVPSYTDFCARGISELEIQNGDNIWCDFEEASGNILLDKSGDDNSGVINGDLTISGKNLVKLEATRMSLGIMLV